MELEDQIRRALARQEPSGDFAARVAAKASRQQGPRPVLSMSSRPKPIWMSRWAAAAIAASLVVGIFGLEEARLYRERERGQAARQQLLQALRITGGKLERIRKKVREMDE